MWRHWISPIVNCLRRTARHCTRLSDASAAHRQFTTGEIRMETGGGKWTKMREYEGQGQHQARPNDGTGKSRRAARWHNQQGVDMVINKQADIKRGDKSHPTYKNKTDRVIHPQASADDIKVDIALAGFTRAMQQMDKKWGIGCLMGLTGPETLAKWGRAMAGLYAAEDTQDAGKVAGWAEVCVRGLAMMDAEATEAGHQPADPHIWEYELDGVTIGVIEDGRMWPAAYRKRKGLLMFNMREVAIALDAHRNDLVRQVKEGFPGAELTAIRRPANDSIEDDLGDVFE